MMTRGRSVGNAALHICRSPIHGECRIARAKSKCFFVLLEKPQARRRVCNTTQKLEQPNKTCHWVMRVPESHSSLYYLARETTDSKSNVIKVQVSFCFFFPTIRQAAYLSTNYECTWHIPLEILSWGPSIFLLGAQHHQKQLDDYGHSGLCSMTTFCRNPKCYSTQIRYDQGPLLVPKEQHDKMSFELTLFLSIYT